LVGLDRCNLFLALVGSGCALLRVPVRGREGFNGGPKVYDCLGEVLELEERGSDGQEEMEVGTVRHRGVRRDAVLARFCV
jgi:hypothetical protein